MKNHKIRLRERRLIALDRVAFVFDASGSGFSFEPGNYAFFTNPSPQLSDIKGHTRPLSIANSPNANGDIMVVSKLGDSVFTKNLMKLSIGDIVYVSEPYTGMSMPEDKEIPVVFVAAGTGIAPVRSLLEHEIKTNARREMLLFYANKSPEQSAFLEDLNAWEKAHDLLRVVYVFKDAPDFEGAFERGVINEKILSKHIRNFPQHRFYLSGPASMIEALRGILLNKGVERSAIIG